MGIQTALTLLLVKENQHAKLFIKMTKLTKVQYRQQETTDFSIVCCMMKPHDRWHNALGRSQVDIKTGELSADGDLLYAIDLLLLVSLVLLYKTVDLYIITL